MAAISQRYEWSCHLIGIDTSRAFDTINHHKLLANTTLTVQIGDITGQPFERTIGTPQGDSLSPILFVCYLEAALRDIRAHTPPQPTPDAHIPTEASYADDVTFISTTKDHLQASLPIIQSRLAEWNLHVNETEWVHLFLSQGNEGGWKHGEMSRHWDLYWETRKTSKDGNNRQTSPS